MVEGDGGAFCSGAYVDGVDIAFVVAVHVPVGEEAVGEEREEDEFGEGEEFIAGEGEAGAAVVC